MDAGDSFARGITQAVTSFVLGIIAPILYEVLQKVQEATNGPTWPLVFFALFIALSFLVEIIQAARGGVAYAAGFITMSLFLQEFWLALAVVIVTIIVLYLKSR